MNKRSMILSVLTVFSLAETFATLISIAFGKSGAPEVTTSSFLVTYSPILSAAGWTAVFLVVLQSRTNRRSQVRRLFVQRGFGADVYDLMIGMRGGTSRLALLQIMDSPKHRLELSEITGIDWKEVDRELRVLEKYGLVKVYAESGTVKLFQVTEQGRLLVRLTEELNAKL